jgi:hypothetical protein
MVQKELCIIANRKIYNKLGVGETQFVNGKINIFSEILMKFK